MLRNEIAPVLSLDGTWDFALSEGTPWSTIRVPGCWEAQGYSKHIDGPACYRREVLIPSAWAGQRIFVEFDAVSYACTVRCNGEKVGEHRGLWTPFAFDITAAVRSGQPNVIELEVYKPGERYPMRSCLAGFLPDVATTFGGIWQSVRLRALSIGLSDLLIDPDPDAGQLRIRCQAITFGPGLVNRMWEVDVLQDGRRVASRYLPTGIDGALDTTLAVPDPILWSPQHPALYTVLIRLSQGGKTLVEAKERIGFRRLSASGEQLLFNGRPVCLRGVLSWGWDPDRIAPTFNAQQARDEMHRVRSLGFNLIKLCLFVPNQTYFDIADEEGLFLWQEWPLWLPQITPEMRAQAPAEYAELMRLTRHHPSVVLYSLGCELSTSVDAELLSTLNDTVRGLASDALVCDNSGSGESYGGLPFDFSDFTDYHPYGDLHHFEPLLDHWRRDWRPSRPWIFGEFCDSDGFRDLDEIVAANGGQKPWWMTEDLPIRTWRPEARALLEEHERLAQASVGFTPQELVQISQLQSLIVRKYTLEAVRRRAGMGGYVITGLRDTPIATSGIFDDLGRPKGSAKEFRLFNDDAILCLDVDRRRRWQYGGDRADRLDVYNWWAGETARWHVILSNAAGPLPAGSKLTWRLTDQDGNVITASESVVRDGVSPGPPREVATVECTLPATPQPCELRLEARLAGGSQDIANHWPIWCYPQPTDWPTGLAIYDPAHVLEDFEDLMSCRWSDPSAVVPSGGRRGTAPTLIVTSALDAWLIEYLHAGGRALLLQQGDGPLPARHGPFWREAIKLFSAHPLWEAFPQRGYADLQFFGLATDVMLDATRLGEVVPGLAQVRPIMRRLDAREFHVTEYLLEAEVGKGWLLACTLRLQGGMGAQPSGLQRNVAGHYLLWAMVQHLTN